MFLTPVLFCTLLLQDLELSAEQQKIQEQAQQILETVEAFTETKKNKLKPYASKDKRVYLFSDFRSKEAKIALKDCSTILACLDRSLIEPEDPSECSLRGIMIEKKRTYEKLCDMLSENVPSMAGFFLRQRATSGFTLYDPPISIYYFEGGIKAEASASHDMAHNFVHLEMNRRYGILPLWIIEGLACAGEDGAFGEVWSNWYRDGFVFSLSHSGWRGKDTQNILEKMKPGFTELFAYTARPYVDTEAHMAFAFLTYALEAEPLGLKKFCDLLKVEYGKNYELGGRFVPSVEFQQKTLLEAFGEGFEARFRAWWVDPPKWNAWQKGVKKKR